MIRKKLCMLLVGCLGLSLMTGCGSKGSNPAEALKERYSQYVDLGDYKGIQYKPTETKITTERVDTEVNRLVTQNGTKVEKKEGVALTGDTVNIDYVGTVDGVEFEGGNTKGAGTEITLGSSGYVDNFDDQIAGHSPGETFDVNVTFPADYHTADLAGKPAVFKTTLNYIVSTEYPELNDELVAEKTEYKTVEEYRAAKEAELVKTQAEEDLETDQEAMMTQMMETSAVKQYPQAELEERVQQLVNQIQNAASSYGMTLDQYLMVFGYDADGFQEEIRTSTEKYIKRKMIVAAIASKEDINVSKDEADAKIKELLSATGLTDVNDLNSRTGYTEEDYYYIVLEEKVIDFIYTNASPKTTDDGETVIVDEGTEAATEGTSTEAASTADTTTEAASEQ
ncbi:MAG: trigger factor [Eubacterium sp.]|nr:trigger factor [Eubacterium sp.]